LETRLSLISRLPPVSADPFLEGELSHLWVSGVRCQVSGVFG
jgi:hypothetical protein